MALFEFGYRMAQGRLTDMQPFGRGGKAARPLNFAHNGEVLAIKHDE